MEPQFWQEQWELNQIGFHQGNVHPLLIEHWNAVGKGSGQVFVPLCGKSLDMTWLQAQGHSILGIDLSPIALVDFFKEQALDLSIRPADGFRWYESNGYQLLCGDFFHLQSQHLQNVAAVYDRAALIALPPPMQNRYAEHLLRLLPHRPPLLIITFEYAAEEMQGPPFPVTEARIAELFGPAYSIETLSATDALAAQPGLKNRGLRGLTEKVHFLHQ